MQDFDSRYGNHTVSDRYAKCVNEIGLDTFKQILPWSKEELCEAYAINPNFLSIKIDKWDQVAGFSENHKTGYITQFPSRLKDTLFKIGVNGYAPAQLVCILKTAAEMIVKEV